MKKLISITSQVAPIILIFIVLAFFLNFLNKSGIRDQLTLWIAGQGDRAVFIFILLAAILYSLMTPGNLLGAMAFILFGFIRGALYLCLAGILSSLLTFYLVRRFLHTPVQNYIAKKPKLYRVQAAVRGKGFSFFFLMRFSPFQAAFVNTLFALSSVRFRDFILSLLAMLPQWILYIYFGYCAASMVDSSPYSLQSIIRYASLAVFISILVYAAQVTRRIIQES